MIFLGTNISKDQRNVKHSIPDPMMLRVTDPIMPFVYMLKYVEEHRPVMVILENGFLLISSGCHMVDSA